MVLVENMMMSSWIPLLRSKRLLTFLSCSAVLFHAKVNELKRMNRLTGASELFMGQVLVVPLLGVEGKPVLDPTPAPTTILEPSDAQNSFPSNLDSSSNRKKTSSTPSDNRNGKSSSTHDIDRDSSDGVDFEPRYAISSAFGAADLDERDTQKSVNHGRNRCPRCVNLRSTSASRCASCSALLAKAQPPPPPSEDNQSLSSSLSLGAPLNLFAAGFRSLIGPASRAPNAAPPPAHAPDSTTTSSTESASNASLAPPAPFDSLRSAVRNWVSRDDSKPTEHAQPSSDNRPEVQQRPPVQAPLEARRQPSTERVTAAAVACTSAVFISGGVNEINSAGPVLRGKSEVLRASHLVQLESVLPTSVQGYAWKLLYSTSLHGAQLGTFYEKGKKEKRTLLVVQTLRGEVFFFNFKNFKSFLSFLPCFSSLSLMVRAPSFKLHTVPYLFAFTCTRFLAGLPRPRGPRKQQ